MRTRDPRISWGFTLVELLVAMMILATLIASVYAAFHAGTMASRRLWKEGNPSSQGMLGHLNLMASEIRNAVYWNNTVMVGTPSELYFYVPMVLKDPKDLFPLYRVRYWIEKSGEKSAVVHRAVVPWILLQKPGMNPENIPSLENTQEWLGPLEDFRLEYAVRKKKQSLTQESTGNGIPVSGNPDLVWRTSYDAQSEIPFGVRMQWTTTSEKGEIVPCSIILWPALGLYQPKPVESSVSPTPRILYLDKR